MSLKNIILALVIVVFLLQILRLKEDGNSSVKQDLKSNKPLIALSTFPLYDIAKNIAKDKLDIYMIIPFGVDAHIYEPNPKDMVKLYKSAIVIYNGAMLEPWIDKLNFQNKTIDMSQYVKLLEIKESSHDEHEHHADTCSHESIDPHYWQSIENMKSSVVKMTQAFIELDPSNKEFFLQNQKEYISMLDNLDKEYKTVLKSCKKKEILTNHNAFSYLANSYGFEILSLSRLSPDADANPKHMIELIEHVKEHNISTIFYENFSSSKSISSIAKETNTKIDSLHPLANITADEYHKNLSYEDIMKENLLKLSEAMNCK